MKLLIVDDEKSMRDDLERSIDMYMMKNPTVKIEPIFCSSFDEAEDKISDEIDVAIVDLKLAGDGDEGNKVISRIKSHWRVLTFVLTGQPDNLYEKDGVIQVYIKGKQGHDVILDEIISIKNTGILDVIGRSGDLEKVIGNIFWRNIIPQLKSWSNHSSKELYDKKFLYRHTLSQLSEELDDHGDFLPEEMYIHPTPDQNYKTGELINSKDGKSSYLVLSPACDLITRACGNMKTEYVMLCRIDDRKRITDSEKKVLKFQKEIDDCACQSECNCDENGRNLNRFNENINKIKKNTFSGNYHYLPTTSFFDGGIVNFRKVSSVKPNELGESYTRTNIRISKNFIKDIVSRFSSYYARQGQPDFHETLI